MRRSTSIDELASGLTSEPPAAVPPPRFRHATFEAYRPTHPSQQDACRQVREFAQRSTRARRRTFWPWRPSSNDAGHGLYLDGGYGVGKTHLLAAAFHAAEGTAKAYLTFQELVHLIGALGMTAATKRFASLSLLCLDEFELDDPGNTLIVKRFLEGIFGSGGSVLTTSNTPPEAQGSGRFNAEDFRREIQGIAARFRVVSLEGDDYRRREHPAGLMPAREFAADLASLEGRPGVVACDFEELLEVLRRLHPIRYRPLLERMSVIFVAGVRTIPSQSDALRFVHFIDQLYDRDVGFRASGGISLDSLFDASYRRSAYAKKHERCISRMGELLDEPLRKPGSSGDGATESVAEPAAKTADRPGSFSQEP